MFTANREQTLSKGSVSVRRAEHPDQGDGRLGEGRSCVNAREGIVHVIAREGIASAKMTSVLLPVFLLLSL